MTYRQVIMHDGVPFSLEIPQKIATRDSITEAEFNKRMATGLAQAKDDENIRVQVTAVIYQRRDQLARLADMEWN